MYDPLGAPHNSHAEQDFTDSISEREAFWGFTLSGGASLEELARFYGLNVPGLEAGATLAQYLSRNGNGDLHRGYCAVVGGAEFRVLELRNGVAARVGLKLRPTKPHSPGRRGRTEGAVG